MVIINQQRLSNDGFSAEANQLAEIRSQAEGDAAVALLNDNDRKLLFSAVNAHAKKEDIPISKIAEDIGVGRTYLYSLLDSDQIELDRLIRLQDYLGIEILLESTVESYLNHLKTFLSKNDDGISWQEKCIQHKVPKFYLLQFLLPALKIEINSWDKTYQISEGYGKKKFGGPLAYDNILFRKLIEYCENNIDGGDWTQVEDDFSSNLKVDFFNIPIDPNLAFWEDIEDETEEAISTYYYDLCDDLDKDLKEKRINKSDHKNMVDEYKKEEKKLEELHANFFEELYEKRAKIVSWAEKIKEYCSSNNRILIREPEYPLEIEKVANNLEESTIPVKEKKAKSK